MAECTHDCSTCGESCGERTEPQSFLKAHNPAARVGKVYGIVSGKGGVGKSMVTSQLAVLARRAGHKVGVLDADVTGPSIPKAFGVHRRAMADERGMLPVETETGIQLISVNLLLDNETDPVIWRGPVIGGVDGIVIVASPQELVSMVVEKAVKMAEMMNIPILGLVENMSYLLCPDCGKEIPLFGQGRTQAAADAHHLPLLARMPIDPALAQLTDEGRIEDLRSQWLVPVIDAVLQ